MKTFEKFLVESSKSYKSLGDNTGKVDTKSGPGNILSDIEQKQFVKNEKNKKKVLRDLQPQNNVKKNVIPDSKPPVTRFDPTEPFQDYDNVTTDRVSNKPPTQTSKVVLGPDGKPLAYKGQNIPVSEPKAGETMIRGIKDTDLEKKALDQTRKDLLKTKTNTVNPDQKSSVDDLTKTTNKVNKVKRLTRRQLRNVEVKNKALNILKDLGKEKKIEDEIKSRNISKQISKSRDLKRLGFGDTNVVRKIDKKIVSLKPKVNITNPKIVSGTTDAAQKYSKLIKKAKFGRGLRTFGRGTGALTSYLDFKATADKERRLGRGKTSQTIGGLSRSLGGYIGGALGAGLAAPIPIPGARIAGAIGGYTAGAAAGEKLYNVGRKFLTRGTKIGGKTYADFKNMLTRKK